MRTPEIPDCFADPLVNLYHQFEGALGPDEGLGKRFRLCTLKKMVNYASSRRIVSTQPRL